MRGFLPILAAGALFYGLCRNPKIETGRVDEKGRLERVGIEKVVGSPSTKTLRPGLSRILNDQYQIKKRMSQKKEDCNGYDKWFLDTYEMIKRHEGKRNWVYDDATGRSLKPGEKARGNRTIGVGFNLERNDARERLEKLGLDYNAIIRGEKPLEDNYIDILFKEDIEAAVSDARRYVPNFDELPNEAKLVVTNMAFNLGYNRLSQFKKLRQALINENYEEAAKEMENSRWYHQVGNRSRELVRVMRSLAQSR